VKVKFLVPKVERGVIAEAHKLAMKVEPELNYYTFRQRYINRNPEAMRLVARVQEKRSTVREQAIRTIEESTVEHS